MLVLSKLLIAYLYNEFKGSHMCKECNEFKGSKVSREMLGVYLPGRQQLLWLSSLPEQEAGSVLVSGAVPTRQL